MLFFTAIYQIINRTEQTSSSIIMLHFFFVLVYFDSIYIVKIRISYSNIVSYNKGFDEDKERIFIFIIENEIVLVTRILGSRLNIIY